MRTSRILNFGRGLGESGDLFLTILQWNESHIKERARNAKQAEKQKTYLSSIFIEISIEIDIQRSDYSGDTFIDVVARSLIIFLFT